MPSWSLHRVLCWIGIHHWEYTIAFQNRTCLICWKHQRNPDYWK